MIKATEKHECAERVSELPHYLHLYLHTHPCRRNATLFEGGQWWCAQHAPSRIDAKQKVSSEKWLQEWAAKQNENNDRERRVALYPEILAALKAIDTYLIGTRTPLKEVVKSLISKCEVKEKPNV